MNSAPRDAQHRGDREAEQRRRREVARDKAFTEVITLVVFVPFAIWFMRVPVGMDFVWAGLCLLGAVFFAFRGIGAVG